MRHRRRLQYPWLPSLAADFAAITAAYYATLLFRFYSATGARLYERISNVVFGTQAGAPGPVLETFYITNAPRIILLLTGTICTLYALNNLYAQRRFILPQPTIWLVSVSNATALLLFYTYFYLTRNVFHPRSLFGSVIVLNVIFATVFRHLSELVMRYARRRFGMDRLTALIAGNAPEANELADFLATFRGAGIEETVRLPDWPGNSFEVALDRLRTTALRHRVDLIICAQPNLTIGQSMHVLAISDDLDLPAKLLTTELCVLPDHARLPTDRVNGIPLVHFDAPRQDTHAGQIRRLVTWLLAGGLLLALAPLMGIIAGLIRMTSHGPALFIQERIGLNRKPFNMLKFRTMHARAEALQADIEVFNEHSDIALFKIRHDPRITPIGRFLRRFSLDELPQLINVLRGEMALVGPRPLPRRDFDNYYEEWHFARHAGLPGLTGLWQISGRSELDFHQMCLLDIYYLRNHTWVLDLKIALRTIRSVIFAKGAY